MTPNNDYTLLIEFEYGNQILFNMQRLVTTMPYHRLSDPELFRDVKFEDKAVCWDTEPPGQTLIPLRLTVDNILFTIRDS